MYFGEWAGSLQSLSDLDKLCKETGLESPVFAEVSQALARLEEIRRYAMSRPGGYKGEIDSPQLPDGSWVHTPYQWRKDVADLWRRVGDVI